MANPHLTEAVLLNSSALDLQRLLDNHTITSVDLVKASLAQIGKYDCHGPNLRAMISVVSTDILLDIAASRDRERRNGKLRGPFHGIPIIVKVSFPFDTALHSLLMLLKDVINTSPSLGLPTTLGSHAFKCAMPKTEAAVVEKVRDAVYNPHMLST